MAIKLLLTALLSVSFTNSVIAEEKPKADLSSGQVYTLMYIKGEGEYAIPTEITGEKNPFLLLNVKI